MIGLPNHVKHLLHASSHTKTMTIDQILTQARAIMKDKTLADEPAVATAQLVDKEK